MRIEADQYGQLDDRFWLYTVHPALRNYLEERYSDDISQTHKDQDFIAKLL